MILSFNHPICLGGWKIRLLRDYAISVQKILKQIRYVFTLIVKVKDFDIGKKLGLNMSLKELENGKYFIFKMQEINLREMSIVVNKSDEIFVTSMKSN